MPLNIAVVGYGGIGPRHAQAVHTCDSTVLCAIVETSPTPHRREAAQREFPEARVYDSLQDCLDQEELDGAVVCTPNHTHFEVATMLIKRGVHVLLEKPMCADLKDARELKRLAKAKKVQVLVGHHRRFNPYVVATKQNMHKLGKVVAFDAVWCLKKCDEYFEQAPWRSSRRAGGGVVQINVVHDLDLLQYFLGPLTEVYATEVAKTRSQDEDNEDAVEEGVVLNLTFQNGTRGSLVVCDNVVAPNNFEMGTGENPLIPKVAHGTDGTFYRFFGTRGTLSVPDLSLFHQEGLKTRGWWEKIQKECVCSNVQGIPFALQMLHFSRVIRGQQRPNCTVDDGIRVMLAVEAIKESLETGLPVKLGPLDESTTVSMKLARL